MDICPRGFLIENSDLIFYLDIYFAIDKGIPLFPNISFFDYPNIIVRALQIVSEELTFQEKLQVKQETRQVIDG